MQQGRADVGRCFRDMASAFPINLNGQPFFRLGLVDRGIGGRVDDDVGPSPGDALEHRHPVFKRDLRPRERHDRDVVSRALKVATSRPGP